MMRQRMIVFYKKVKQLEEDPTLDKIDFLETKIKLYGALKKLLRTVILTKDKGL